MLELQSDYYLLKVYLIVFFLMDYAHWKSIGVFVIIIA